MNSVGQIRTASANAIQAVGIETAQLDADLIIGAVLKKSRIELISGSDQILTEPERIAIEALIQRRTKRVPVAYLIERKEFWGLDFFVDPRVLIPRPETELLVESVLRFVNENRSKDYRILDLCTGIRGYRYINS